MILFRLLGPVTIGSTDDQATFGTPILRALLAAFLLNLNQFITTGRIAEHLWHTPPASVAANLRTHAAALRRSLESRQPALGRRMHTRRGGTGGTAYRLEVEPCEVDAEVFDRLVLTGHRALSGADPAGAVVALEAALRLWRGPVGEDLPDTPLLRQHAEILAEQRLRTQEDLLAARLALGESGGVLTGLREAATEAPLRERTRELLVRALYRAGDAAGALAAYDDYRRAIGREVGAVPSPRMERLYLAVLRHDDAVLSEDPGPGDRLPALSRC
jgi:DNA-binding SARP family transcriptional activator